MTIRNLPHPKRRHVPGYMPVPGSDRFPADDAVDLGPTAADEPLSVTIVLRRQPGAPPMPDLSELRRMMQGDIPYLNREDFINMYGASTQDLNAIEDFVFQSGLRLEESSIPRRQVIASGTADKMSHAFQVELRTYGLAASPNETFPGRVGPVYVPSAIAPIVRGVFGLDKRRMARRATCEPTYSAPGAGLTGLQVLGRYGFPVKSESDWSASNQTIGLLEFGGGYLDGDISEFFNTFGGRGPKTVDAISVLGKTNYPDLSADQGEVTLDIEVAASAAPGASIKVYFAPWTEQGWVTALSKAILDPSTPSEPTPLSALSISWDWPETAKGKVPGWTKSAFDTLSCYFFEAATLGISVFVASGDDGVRCKIYDMLAHVNYPASDPNVTSCGGTMWQGGREVVWNDPLGGGSSGGGISDIFPPPVWQALEKGALQSLNPGVGEGRALPDVAAYAGPYCLFPADGSGSPAYGTSAVAPLWAAIAACINERLKHRVGFLNLWLYGDWHALMRCVTEGNNLPSDSHRPFYFKAESSYGGWNACTGWGTPDGCRLSEALSLAEVDLSGVDTSVP